MVDQNTAKRELARWEPLRFPPQTDAGIRELLTTLGNACRSPEHCRAVVSEILSHADQWPTPRIIREVAWSLLSEKEKQGRTCPHCTNGWVHRVVKGYSCVAECECRKVLEAKTA
jgi:hypothetical protein